MMKILFALSPSLNSNRFVGFSINVNVEPEILIVDEILSVGDISFQAKSEKKMMDMISGGTTVFYV